MDDWVNGGYVNVLFACSKCVFSFFGSWCKNSKFPALFSFGDPAGNIQKDRAHGSHLRRMKFIFTCSNDKNLVISKGNFDFIK